MIDNFRMGLKPTKHQYSINPAIYTSVPIFDYVLPPALADGFYKSKVKLALATY